MKTPSSIRLLGSTNNERGDLFTRLTKDLFFSLGYDNLSLNVAASGREIDIQGEHRFEARRVCAECKAHSDPIGGGDTNKFLGILTRERAKYAPGSVSGYFVSLSGFTSTGIQQEADSGNSGVILLDAKKSIEELQRGRVIVSLVDATAIAGTCVQAHGMSDLQIEGAELLGDKIGYIWCIYLGRGKLKTHFVLVHADGTPLANSLAQSVVTNDRLDGGNLHELTYLTAPTPVINLQSKRSEALNSYKRWLGEECGFIQLDGLPADSDLSATKLKLEKLFVPLKCIYANLVKKPDTQLEGTQPTAVIEDHIDPTQLNIAEIELSESESSGSGKQESQEETVTEPIGLAMERFKHLAILANPGGGKSTLLKRLATAFSFPERKGEVPDALPAWNALPLYLRCRDLRDRSHRPLVELLHGIAAFANMADEEAACFRAAISESLRTGNALLLIDGLDEISDEGARRTFAQNLRTFVAMFPQVSLILTSRIAGFREIAGVVSGVCKKVTLAPLDENDVRRLCISWHAEVVADTAKVRSDSNELASAIWKNTHIRKLVENPLLLTTLLVVKRSNGEIPPTRVELYSEAVRVLVRTWNVEGYAPLDERETLARLSYVACAMMQKGIQIIGNTALINLLNDAGKELEAELQFTLVSPSEFIRRIEYRSSLLMQTGYQRIDNELQPVYEFRHLTFQEYLAAKGFVVEQYPGRNEELPLVEILAPRIVDERWQEVIPLSCVLAGRKADPVLKAIAEVSSTLSNAVGAHNPEEGRATRLLARCLLEGVTITPTTLKACLLEIGLKVNTAPTTSWGDSLSASKYGTTYQEVIEETFFSAGKNWTYLDSALSEISRRVLRKGSADLLRFELAKEIAEILESGERHSRVRATLVLMRIAFELRSEPAKKTEILSPFASRYISELSQMISSNDLPSAQAATWALAWLGTARACTDPTPIDTLKSLIKHWYRAEAPELTRKSAWAFSTQPLHPRDSFDSNTWGVTDDWIAAEYAGGKSESMGAALILAWYRRSPWNDSELLDKVVQHFGTRIKMDAHSSPTAIAILESLGEPGQAALKTFRQSKRKGKKMGPIRSRTT